MNISELKQKFLEDFPALFTKFFSFLKEKNLLLYDELLDMAYFNDENDTNKLKKKLACEIMLDIIFNFYFVGNYSDKLINSFLFNVKSPTSIFYTRDEKMFSSKEKKEKENIPLNNDKEGEKSYHEKIEEFSFCIYFLLYFFEKDLKCQDQEKKKTINNIKETIFNDVKNLYINNKKLSSILKRIRNKGKHFDVYNEILDFFNKYNKEPTFSLISVQERYIQLINQFKKETDNNILNEAIKKQNGEGRISHKNKEITEEKKPETSTEKYHKNNEINNKASNNDINSDTKNQTNNINNNVENKTINDNNGVSSVAYLKEELSKIDSINFYFKSVVGKDYSKELTKIFFNPKEYYIWKQFGFFLKDYIFFSRKFKKLAKTFGVHKSKIIYKKKEKYKDKNNLYLDYPTKLRNYTIDEYYRPFLKPCTNFFNLKHLDISHKYVEQNLLKKIEFKEENLNLNKYKKIIPKLSNEKYFCELVKNKGNIFGFIELNKSCFIFKNSPNDDMSLSNDPEKSLPFLCSISDDKIIDKDKNVLIFYEDIKEIIKRRFCLLYIGLEFFLKDNRTYSFNFFNKNNIHKFIEDIKKYTLERGEHIKNTSGVNEDSQKHDNKNVISSQDNINSISSINVTNSNSSEINFKLIEDPISEFKKLNLKLKYKKGELSNFEYLLLINKYSSRTYNDYNQYLVFPILYMDAENKIKRDLSKAICLNKDKNEIALNKIRTNFAFYKFHFNQHYSTGGYILFYLVRLIPFTYQHIIFQSMKFDVPTRLFSSLNNIYLFFQVTEDNRELIPEFYHSFEFLINLNHNDFGVMETREEKYHLDNVDIWCKYSFPEYIIKSRNNLDQSDLSPWIDNIFGAKQTFGTMEQPNLFSLNSYEEFSKLENIIEEDKPLKEKVLEIKENVDLFKFGTSPAKMFNKPHEKMTIKNFEKSEEDLSNNIKKEEKSLNVINKYIQKKIKEKADFYLINTKNDNDIELIFKFRNKVDIFKLKFGETKNTEISLKIQEQINLDNYKNSFCEIFPEIYCFVRHIDNTISFISRKKIISIYYFNCLVTSVENKHNKNMEEKTYKEIFIGDEKGFLHLIEIDFNQNEKICEIKNIKIKKTAKTNEGCITGLLHNERLNIIISWCKENEDYISLNNDYDLKLMNIIRIEKNNIINEVLVSKYDLIFISTYDKISRNYKVYSYTLNGIKISFYEGIQKIIKCFSNEKMNIIVDNNNGFSFYLYTFDELCNNFYCDFTKDYKAFEIKINHCQYYPKKKKYLMICSHNKSFFYNNDNDYI